MRKPKSQPVFKFLIDGHNPSTKLLQHGHELRRLTRILHALLPAPCAQHCRVANIKHDTLILAADSPAWSARLRFHVPQLLDALNRQCGLQLANVRILVSPTQISLARRNRPRPDLSHKSAQLLREAARSIDVPELKAALLRLSRRGGHKKPD